MSKPPVFVFYQALRTHKEAEKTAVTVDFLDTVEEAADYIVTAGGLAAAEDYTYVDGLAGCGCGIFFETDFRQAVGVGE